MTKKIVMPTPLKDFDPTEVAIPWRILKNQGFEVIFASPTGQQAQADPIMLSGEGLDPWGWIPGVKRAKALGLILRAQRTTRIAHTQLCHDANFQAPLSYAELHAQNFDGLFLPGGHAQGIKTYLEDKQLQAFVADFFDANTNQTPKPVAAICHGVVLAARSQSHKTGKSVLYGRKTTALTWDLEKSAWNLTRYYGRFWDRNYYRTYMEKRGEAAGFRSVEAEVKRALAQESDFLKPDRNSPHAWRKTSGLHRDSLFDARPAWVVQDGHYLSARWPGDVHTLARNFAQCLTK